jgi:hypothetical protein
MLSVQFNIVNLANGNFHGVFRWQVTILEIDRKEKQLKNGFSNNDNGFCSKAFIKINQYGTNIKVVYIMRVVVDLYITIHDKSNNMETAIFSENLFFIGYKITCNNLCWCMNSVQSPSPMTVCSLSSNYFWPEWNPTNLIIKQQQCNQCQSPCLLVWGGCCTVGCRIYKNVRVCATLWSKNQIREAGVEKTPQFYCL